MSNRSQCLFQTQKDQSILISFLMFYWQFNSQKWSTLYSPSPFIIQSYIINQTGNENIQTYQVEVVLLV